jgi:hypothetical protein
MLEDMLSSALLKLKVNDVPRSETARLRDIIEDIERAQKAGYSRENILGLLQQAGISLTLKGFEMALYRIRKRNVNQSLLTDTKSLECSSLNTVDETSLAKSSKEIRSESNEILTAKQRREKLADQYIKPNTGIDDPFIKRLLEKEKNK